VIPVAIGVRVLITQDSELDKIIEKFRLENAEIKKHAEELEIDARAKSSVDTSGVEESSDDEVTAETVNFDNNNQEWTTVTPDGKKEPLKTTTTPEQV
jgi:hypothetical protein